MISKKINKRSIVTLAFILLSTIAPAAAMWKPKNDTQKNALNLCFLNAVIKGNVEKVHDYLSKKDDENNLIVNINFRNKQEFTPLLIACAKGYTNIVEMLLKNDADLIYSYDDNHTNFLMWAIRNDHTETATAVIKYCCSWDNKKKSYYLRATNKHGHNALHWAAKRGNKAIILLLLKNNVSVNSKASNFCDETPLHAAASEGKTEAAKILIENGAHVKAKTTYDHETPLMCAIRKGHLEMIRLLIKYSDTSSLKEAFNYACSNKKTIAIDYFKNLDCIKN